MLQKVVEKLVSGFEKAQFNPTGSLSHPVLTVRVEDLLEVARVLNKDKNASFDHLSFVTAVDYLDHFELDYLVNSYKHHYTLLVKTTVSGSKPQAPSVTSIWTTADFHEREVYDLYGIEFTGHPNLERILLAADFQGHPFRKDHAFENDEAYLLKEGYPEGQRGKA